MSICTSCPCAARKQSVNFMASAPYSSITSSGSIPFPRDLDIFLPWVSLTRPVITISLKGAFPKNSSLAIIILLIQKKMMSYAETRVFVWKNLSKSGVFSGQPRVENGQSQEENQVSRTSVSCFKLWLWHFGHSVASSLDTIISPQSSQYHTGILCPHQSWREIHQSLIVSIQWI